MSELEERNRKQMYSMIFLRDQVANLEKRLESSTELVGLWRKEAYFQVALQGVGQEPEWSDPDALSITEGTKKRHEEIMAAQVAQFEEFVGIADRRFDSEETEESRGAAAFEYFLQRASYYQRKQAKAEKEEEGATNE